MRLSEPKRITDQSWPDGTVPVVSIFSITYNHVNFIRDAIEGFLMQETTFPVEIFIHDDASTDGTAEIVKEYADKYPWLFRTLLQTENQWSKGIANSLFFRLMQEQSGEFIALCEGDDYWTDERKLQKQVTFLWNNPEFVACGHGARYLNSAGEFIGEAPPKNYQRDYSNEELIKVHCWIATNSLLFRKIKFVTDEFATALHGDNVLTSMLGHHGRFKYLPEVKPFAYRLHPGGVHSALSRRDVSVEQINTKIVLFKYYKKHKMYAYAQSFYDTIKFQMKSEGSSAKVVFRGRSG
jgi:glycosyltransferase involved in cell wall biosynthesis